MDSMNVNLLAPSTQDVTADKTNVKASDNVSKDSKNSFDNQLNKLKEKDTKPTKTAKSVVNDNSKELGVSKSVEIKPLDEVESKEAIDNTILSLISNVLQIPIEDIKQILAKMNIQPTDLLNQDTFKEFLTQAYPGFNEEQLLLGEGKLKDISKLFDKLEQISTLLDDGQSTKVIEKLVADDEVIKTTTKVNKTSEKAVQAVTQQTAEDTNPAKSTEIVSEILQNKAAVMGETAKNNLIDEAIPEGNVSDEGLLSFKQMGLGINIPIQAFNSSANTKFWDAQNAATTASKLLQDNPLTEQIINKLDISSLGAHKEITMELSPKELGNLSIKLVENNGALVANIRVDNEKTKELLLSEIKQLEATLEKQGLSVSEVKVDVRQNPHQSQMEQQRQKSARRIQELIDRNLTEEIDETAQQVDAATGEFIETEVNYMV